MGLTSDISWRLVYRSPTVRVGDVRCQANNPARGGEEASTHDTIVLPRAGVFVRHVRGEAVTVCCKECADKLKKRKPARR